MARQLLFTLVILVFGTLALIIGFLIIGLRVERSIRWLHMTYVALGARRNYGSHQLVGGRLSSNQRRRVYRRAHLRADPDVLRYGHRRWPLLPHRRKARPSASPPMSQPYPYGAQPSVPLYPPQPGPQAYPPPYPPQQRPPYYPPNPGAPQYPPQQGAPQYPHAPTCRRPAALSAQRGPAATLPATVSTAAGSATASSALSATAAARRRAGWERPISAPLALADSAALRFSMSSVAYSLARESEDSPCPP